MSHGRESYGNSDDSDDGLGRGGGSGNHHVLEYVREENGSLKRVVDTEGHLLAQDSPLNGE